jgi:hypothetical protein
MAAGRVEVTVTEVVEEGMAVSLIEAEGTLIVVNKIRATSSVSNAISTAIMPIGVQGRKRRMKRLIMPEQTWNHQCCMQRWRFQNHHIADQARFRGSYV